MARNTDIANGELFRRMEQFCLRRGSLLQVTGVVRYLYGDDLAPQWGRRSIIHEVVEFGFHRSLMRIELDSTDYIGLVGFD